MKPSIKYRVIYRYIDKYSVNFMCNFFSVSRSGYYDFIKRIDNPVKDKAIAELKYIKTKQGILYLSMIKNLYKNFIVAYNMEIVQNNVFVYRTIKMAKKEVANGLILHSDQGFQYTSHGYFNLTKDYGIMPSMSRPETPLDNACAENFFGIIKAECIYRNEIKTFNEAKNLIYNYIHFYNYQKIQLKTKLTPFKKRCQSLAN